MKTRTVVCGRRMLFSGGTHCMELVIPAWKPDIRVLLPMTSIPREVFKAATKFPDNGFRFYAQVNLDAQSPQELLISDFEGMNLAQVFKKPELV